MLLMPQIYGGGGMGTRRNRLGLPKVNQDPVPPNATPQQKLASRVANGTYKGPTGTPGSPGGNGSGTHGGSGQHSGGPGAGGSPNPPNPTRHYGQPPGSGGAGTNPGGSGQHSNGPGAGGGTGGGFGQPPGHPSYGAPSGPKYGAQKPTPPPGPGQPGTGPGVQVDPNSPFQVQPFPTGAGQIPANDPYWTNVASLLFNAQQQYGDLKLQDTYAKDDRTNSLARMATDRYWQQQGDASNAMGQGLAYSGALNNTDARHGGDYLNSVNDLNTNYGRGANERGGKEQGLVEGFPLSVAGEQASALQRFAQAQADRAHTAPPAISNADIKALRRLLSGGKGHGHHG